MFKIVLICSFFILFPLQNKASDLESPAARWGHVFVYDQLRNEILLFGGALDAKTFVNDTWIWNQDGWRKIDISGPSARGFSAATYHPGRKTIVIHGGRSNTGNTLSDSWEWNGEKWNQIASENKYVADHHQMVYVHDEKSIIAFGGWNGQSVLGDTWYFKNSWKKSNIISPPARASFGMAYNEIKSTISLYGGLWVNGQYADIWQWKLGQWKELGGPYDQSSLDHHAMFYDKKTNKIIGFGGKNYRYKTPGKIFEINESDMKVINFSSGPSPRHSVGITYHNKNQKAYIFGGKELSNGKQLPLSDLWSWDSMKWKKIE